MHPDDYVGWLALALTPGLGARTAGKLLREFGSPDAIFNASLTSLEGQRVPAAVAQALHSKRPLSDAAKELAQAQAAAAIWSLGTNLSIRRGCGKSTIRRRCCMSLERLNFSTGT